MNLAKKSKLPSVEIRGILEMTNNKSNGIEIIRKILLDAIKESQNEKIEILYLGAPKYRLSIIAQDFKTAEKTLKPILEKIEKNASKLRVVHSNFLEKNLRKLVRDNCIFS